MDVDIVIMQKHKLLQLNSI